MSLYALTEVGNKLFEYHKSHLVPFGEYMPLKWLLPFKKLTTGLLDYTEGEVSYIDNLLPNKLKFETLYSQFGDICALLAIITTLISYILIKNLININKKLLD